MKKMIKTMALLLLVAATFTECKKEVAGPKGDPGTPGTNGNANVKTIIFTAIPSNWSYGPGNVYAEATCNWSEINMDIVDKGIVMVYIEAGPNTWSPLPLTVYNTGYQTLYDFTYTLGKATVSVAFSNGGALSVNSNVKFKLVAIAASGIIKDVDVNNYNDVKEAYHLQD